MLAAPDFTELASSLTQEEIPIKLRCAICSKLALDAFRLPCCDQSICGSCQTTLPESCPVCMHSPLVPDDCKQYKALRLTVKAFLKSEEKKRIKARAEAAQPATEKPLATAPKLASEQQSEAGAQQGGQTGVDVGPSASEKAQGTIDGQTNTLENGGQKQPEEESVRRDITTDSRKAQENTPNLKASEQDKEEVPSGPNHIAGNSNDAETTQGLNGSSNDTNTQQFNNQSAFDQTQNGLGIGGWGNGYNIMSNGNQGGFSQAGWNNYNEQLPMGNTGFGPGHMTHGMVNSFGGPNMGMGMDMSMGMGMNGMNISNDYNSGYGGYWNAQQAGENFGGAHHSNFYSTGGYNHHPHHGHFHQGQMNQMNHMNHPQFQRHNFNNQNRFQNRGGFHARGAGRGSFSQHQSLPSHLTEGAREDGNGFGSRHIEMRRDEGNTDIQALESPTNGPALEDRAENQNSKPDEATVKSTTPDPAEPKNVTSGGEAERPEPTNDDGQSKQILYPIATVVPNDDLGDVDQGPTTNFDAIPSTAHALRAPQHHFQQPIHTNMNNFGARGAFNQRGFKRGSFAGRGAVGFATRPNWAYSDEYTVVTPKETFGQGVQGAPKGPKAMRDRVASTRPGPDISGNGHSHSTSTGSTMDNDRRRSSLGDSSRQAQRGSASPSRGNVGQASNGADDPVSECNAHDRSRDDSVDSNPASPESSHHERRRHRSSRSRRDRSRHRSVNRDDDSNRDARQHRRRPRSPQEGNRDDSANEEHRGSTHSRRQSDRRGDRDQDRDRSRREHRHRREKNRGEDDVRDARRSRHHRSPSSDRYSSEDDYHRSRRRRKGHERRHSERTTTEASDVTEVEFKIQGRSRHAMPPPSSSHAASSSKTSPPPRGPRADRERDFHDPRSSKSNSSRAAEPAAAQVDPHTLEREARNRERMLKEQQRRQSLQQSSSGSRKRSADDQTSPPTGPSAHRDSSSRRGERKIRRVSYKYEDEENDEDRAVRVERERERGRWG